MRPPSRLAKYPWPAAEAQRDTARAERLGRHAPSEDARERRLELTGEGRRKLAAAFPDWKEVQGRCAIHMPPTDLPGVGRFAMVADPQGVPFYVMRGSVEGTSEAFKPMTVGHCGWNELVTTDQAAALDFYQAQFGWELGNAMPMGEAGDYRFIELGGEMIGAVMNRMDGDQPTRWNFYFRVPRIAAAVKDINARGGAIHLGPEEVPGGDHVVNATDPHGVSFGLVGPEK